MSGMGGPIVTTNPLLVQSFQSHLLHQSLVVVVLLAALAVAWNLLRASQLRRAAATPPSSKATDTEPAARLVLRVGFGLLWIFDGILQGQAEMPAGLADRVMRPAAQGSPSFVVHLVHWGALLWDNHPIVAAVSAVWIQVGIGLWLLVAPRGRWSQLAGAAGTVWGLGVWCFGEAFGGIFASGATFLFGLPGAALCYVLAGALVALPEGAWARWRLSAGLLRGFGAFLLGMAVLQAWPGRGFWQGHANRYRPGAIATMASDMASTPQPPLFAHAARSFASFDESHGFAVNLVAVVVLAVCGLAFVAGRRAALQVALGLFALFCLADWVLVQDFGFFGGLGTDPNSMIPMLLVAIAGYLALARAPASAPAAARAWREQLRESPSYALRLLAAGGAMVVTLVGATPMAIAAANPAADAIVTEAVNGTPQPTDAVAPPFALENVAGRPVSLASLRGKAIAMTFLDPVCTSDCPLIAQAFAQADRMLGANAHRVELVAVVANPIYRSATVVKDFDREEGLDALPNWTFLTGSLAALRSTWGSYGVEVSTTAAGAMIAHTDVAYIIDANGHTRYVLNADPGPGTVSSQSSFAGLIASELTSVLAAR